MKIYVDAQSYPGTRQADGSYDGGDTAAIIGTIEALNVAPNHIPCIPFNVDADAPLRHPDISKWYGQPDRFSRDQLIAAICGGISDLSSSIRYIYSSHKRRYFLTAWNTKGNGAMNLPNKFPDVCGPEVWALWIRYKRPFWARLVLAVLDVQTLIGAIQWRWFESKTNRVTRNHMLVCLTCRDVLPTLTSRLANRINNWQDLVSKWEAHCLAVGEYPTADLFKAKIGEKK